MSFRNELVSVNNNRNRVTSACWQKFIKLQIQVNLIGNLCKYFNSLISLCSLNGIGFIKQLETVFTMFVLRRLLQTLREFGKIFAHLCTARIIEI